MLTIRELKKLSTDKASIGPQSKSLTTLHVVENPVVDVAAMSASACINTDAIDYQGEAILASGVELANYSLNPVVLYEHGKGAINFPIGKSECSMGELHIERSDYDMHGTCFFSQTLPVARQVYGLIEEGVLRATSIQVIPKVVSVYVGKDGKRYPVTEQSDMVEWSWCMNGVNPESVKKSLGFLPETLERCLWLQADRASVVLNRGSLGGDRLLEPIRKSLLSVIPKPRASSPGADFIKGKEMAGTKLLTPRELRKLSADDLKAIVSSDDYDEKTQAKAKSLYEEAIKNTPDDAPEGDEVESEEKGMYGDEKEKSLDADDDDAEEEAEEGDDKPLGAKVLGEIYASAQYVVEMATKALGPVENEVVKSGAEGLIADMQAVLDGIAGLFSTAYPDMPALGSVAVDTETDEVESQMKSLLAQHRTAGFRSLGLAGAIQRLASDPSIAAPQRKSLSAIADRMTHLIDEAKQFKAPVAGDVVPRAEHEALKSQLNKLISQVEKLVPAS